MEKPIVNIISSQTESEHVKVDLPQSDINGLLAKYGYVENHHIEQVKTPSCDLTFEEMIQQEELRLNQESLNRKRPNVMTIDPYAVKYHQTHYDTDDESGFGYHITIASDMDIKK
jgi:hypothetical protein